MIEHASVCTTTNILPLEFNYTIHYWITKCVRSKFVEVLEICFILVLRMEFIRKICVKLKDIKYGSVDFIGFENVR